MRRKKKRRGGTESVELNLAAMLDMAFQLLAFFIMTFKPAPIEGQINLKLPPSQPLTNVNSGQQAGADEKNQNAVKGLNSLVISVLSDSGGKISTMAIGEGTVSGLTALENRLKGVLGPESGAEFDQVIIQVGSRLKYDQLMKVVDVCTRQTLSTGEKLSKLSFVEMPENE